MSQASSCHISSTNIAARDGRRDQNNPERMAEEGDIGIAISHIGNEDLCRESQEALWTSEDGIIVTSSVGVVVHDKPEQHDDQLEANYYVFDKA